MKRLSDKALSIVVLIVVTCSIVFSGFTATQELIHRRPPAAVRVIPDWQDYFNVGHRLGTAAAPVKIVIFSDYQCAACRIAFSEIERARRKNPETITVVMRHFPMRMQGESERAARVAICADNQKRFAPMNKLLFMAGDSLETLPTETLARSANIPDTKSFLNCMQAVSTTAMVLNDIDTGRELNVGRIPVLLINGDEYVGTTGVRALIKRYVGHAKE